MMKNIYNVRTRAAAVIAVALGMASCLEKIPGDAIPEGMGMKTFSDAEQHLTGIYSAYMSSALYSGYLTLLPDIQTDLVMAVQGNSNTYGPVWQWDIRPTNSEITAVYGSLYNVIARCNFFLDKVEDVRAGLTDDENITYLDYYTGEVYCARANAYAELIKCFCEAYDPAKADSQMGVALDSTYFGAKPTKRSTLKESYEFVIRDLKKSEEYFGEDYEYDAPTNPYVTSAAVKALLARIALYMQDWDSAIKYSSELIESEEFALATADIKYSGTDVIQGGARTMSDFDVMWNYDSADEIIWQISFTSTSYGGALGQVFLNYNNDYVYLYPDYMPSEWVIGLYGNSDVRRTAYFRTLQTGYSGNPSLTLLIKYYGNVEMFIPYNIFHVCQPKPIRLAEMYLIRAEAYCRSNAKDYGKATADLKTLAQARGASVGSLNANNWLQVISDERVKELYMEGFRLNDLRRWVNLPEWNKGSDLAFKRTTQSSAQTGAASTIQIKKNDHRLVWPIPQHEIEAPGSCMKGQQNRGY